MSDRVYEISFRKSVKKDIKGIPHNDLVKIFTSIENLATNPIPTNAIKLKGSDTMYRIREGNYRIVYDIEFDTIVITIIRIGHRKNVYKD